MNKKTNKSLPVRKVLNRVPSIQELSLVLSNPAYDRFYMPPSAPVSAIHTALRMGIAIV